MTVTDLNEEIFVDTSSEGMDEGAVLLRTAHRLYRKVLPYARNVFGGRVACLPLTKQEVRQMIYKRRNHDEANAIRLLGQLGSEASRIYKKL